MTMKRPAWLPPDWCLRKKATVSSGLIFLSRPWIQWNNNKNQIEENVSSSVSLLLTERLTDDSLNISRLVFECSLWSLIKPSWFRPISSVTAASSILTQLMTEPPQREQRIIRCLADSQLFRGPDHCNRVQEPPPGVVAGCSWEGGSCHALCRAVRPFRLV